MLNMSEMRLYNTDGRRLYLNAEERTAFLLAAVAQPPKPDCLLRPCTTQAVGSPKRWR